MTSAARTVADLALSVPFEQAVVGGDGALNMGLVTGPELDKTINAFRRRHGFKAAARVIAFMDHRSETAGESRSRVAIHRLGLPKPELQRVVRRGHVRLGRVDFWIEDHCVVGSSTAGGSTSGAAAEMGSALAGGRLCGPAKAVALTLPIFASRLSL